LTTNTSARIGRAGFRASADSAVAPKRYNIAPFKTACSTCNLRELCLPCCGLTHSEKDAADHLMFNRRRMRRGEHLYRTGDRFTSLYAVRDGFFKSLVLIERGREQVTGFSMTGEVLGTDGIGLERHTCNAVALEDSEVCAIPFAGLQDLVHKIPSLQHHMHRMMSREIVREQGMMLQLGSMNAEERLSMFLLNLSKRFAARGWPPSEFKLRMTREEIGSYLGLKLETVSRTFSKFHEEGLIGVQNKSIRILDSAGLERVMGRALP
jgi:CRP/FNR family transcriptional regulator